MKKYLPIALALAALATAGATPVFAQTLYPGQSTVYSPASPWGDFGSTRPQPGPGCGIACER